MPALETLAAAFHDVRSAVELGVQKIAQLSQDLAEARAEAANGAVIEQIAAELHATADQLRLALAAADQTPPHA